MKKISGSTLYYKKIFPTIWFGLLGFMIILQLASGKASFFTLIFPLAMAAFGFVLFRKLVWDLVDEAYDYGDALLFRNGEVEQKVELSEIINIDYTDMSAPERVTVHCRNSGSLGKEIVFTLPTRFNPFSKSPVVRDLIERVDTSRRA